MDSPWPWLALAAAGALHGLNPAAGWAFAACGLRSGGQAGVLRALLPIAVGNVAAMGMVAAAVPAASRLRLEIDGRVLQGLAVGLLLVLAVLRVRGHAARPGWRPAGQFGLALWSFIAGTAHGAGLMLVPMLAPLCAGDVLARERLETGTILLALTAVGVHMAGMLATTAAMAALAQRGLGAVRRRLRGRRCSDRSVGALLS